jgi:hypothetical protein
LSSDQPSFKTKNLITHFRMSAADSSPEVIRKEILAALLSRISLSDRSGATRTLLGKRVNTLLARSCAHVSATDSRVERS